MLRVKVRGRSTMACGRGPSLRGGPRFVVFRHRLDNYGLGYEPVCDVNCVQRSLP